MRILVSLKLISHDIKKWLNCVARALYCKKLFPVPDAVVISKPFIDHLNGNLCRNQYSSFINRHGFRWRGVHWEWAPFQKYIQVAAAETKSMAHALAQKPSSHRFMSNKCRRPGSAWRGHAQHRFSANGVLALLFTSAVCSWCSVRTSRNIDTYSLAAYYTLMPSGEYSLIFL